MYFTSFCCSQMASCYADEDEILISRTTAFSSRLLEELVTLHNDADLTDFSLNTGGKTIECHRVILAANSPVLKAMLKSKMKEASQNQMDLDNIFPQVLDIVVRYMYTGEARIPREALKDVIAAADYLQMYELTQICIERSPPVIQPNNVISWFKLSDMMNLQQLKSMCSRIMTWNLNELQSEREFLELNLAELTSYLEEIKKSDADGDDLLGASLDWINADPQGRRESMEALLQMVPMEKCSLECLEEEQEKHEDLLDFKTKNLISRSILVITEQENPRKKHSVKINSQQRILMGGYDMDVRGDAIINNQCWLLDSLQSLSELCTIPDEHVHYESSFCKTPEGFALTGGKDSDDCVMYNVKNNNWKRLVKLSKTRFRHGSVFVDNLLFVCGGFVDGRSSNCVNYMDMSKGSWQSGPNMLGAVNYPEVVCSDNNDIFLLDTVNRQLFQMEIASKSWSIKAALPDELKASIYGARMICVKDQFCVTAGSSGALAWYTPATDMWSVGTKFQLKHQRGAVVQHHNTILVLGGFEQEKVESYNIDSGVWSVCDWKIPKPLCNLHAFNLD